MQVIDKSVANIIPIKLPKPIKPSIKINSTTTAISTKPKNNTVQSLRNLQGQFTSVTKIQNLINASLRQTIVKNMQRPNLRNQTGRFASSVKLESVSQARDGALTAFLSYMRYPYATFEKGGKQGKKGYYPSRLIDQSVREIAKTLVTQRMKVTVQ